MQKYVKEHKRSHIYTKELESHSQFTMNQLLLSWENKTNVEIHQWIAHISGSKALRKNVQNDNSRIAIDHHISPISPNALSSTSTSSKKPTSLAFRTLSSRLTQHLAFKLCGFIVLMTLSLNFAGCKTAFLRGKKWVTGLGHLWIQITS